MGKEIIKMILNSNADLLKFDYPNCITFQEHWICVMLHKQDDPQFQV